MKEEKITKLLFCWQCGKRGVIGIEPYNWFCSKRCKTLYFATVGLK
jgi:endogenous inhibitor of DNA gyrase (YacG/DUF329 family)